MKINERIKNIRKALDLSQNEFAKKIGIGQAAISALEKGIRNVTDQTILLLCSTYNINENYLRNGTLPMFNQDKDFSLDKYAKERGASDIDIEILKIYLDLDKDVRKKIVSNFKKIFVENKDTYINNYLSSDNKEIQTEKEKNINIIEQEHKQKPTIIRVPARGGYYEIEQTEERKAALRKDAENKYEYNPDDF